MAETTIMLWVHRHAPDFGRRRSRSAQSAGASWRVDKTYAKVHGEWVFLYRTVYRAGIAERIRFDNHSRLRQSLGIRTPMAV